MKVLIVTIFNSLNYGAFLQGYGLYQVLCQKGCDVTMYLADPHNIKYYIHALRLRESRNIVYNIKLLNSFFKSWSLVKQTNNLEDEYDLAIIGSDELWNVHNVNFVHSNIYLGYNIKAKKICTYAISGNNTTSKQFVSLYGNEPFKYLDEIAVRDECTKKLVSEIKQINPTNVIDPTLLYDFTIQERKKEKNYLVVYGYYFEEDEKKQILDYAKERDLKLISAGFIHRWCDEIFTDTPLEFLNLIKNSEGVISATFHGTILSMKYNKKLAVFHHGSQKIIDALLRYGMMKCAVGMANKISECFQFSADYNQFNNILKEEIIRSNEYLNSVLKTENTTK